MSMLIVLGDLDKFIGLLDRYGLKQHVSEMTHARGHTLDLIITRERAVDSSEVSRKYPLLDCVIQRESYPMITVLLRAN